MPGEIIAIAADHAGFALPALSAGLQRRGGDARDRAIRMAVTVEPRDFARPVAKLS